MASAEAELRRDRTQDRNHGSDIHLAVDETKQHHRSESSTSMALDERDINDEITWHYLTFETELPTPFHLSRLSSKQSHANPPPECSDLNRYTSPFLWSESRKSFMLLLSCIATVFTAYNAGAYVPGITQMSEEWHVGQVTALVGVTLFTCGFCIAPMFLAPFSEINGRRPIFVSSGLFFVVFQILCAVTPTFGGMLVGRFLVGCASSTFSTVVGGVVSDIYHAKDRNTAMTLFSASTLMGTGLGPLVSGLIAQNITWRWIFYLQIIIDGVLLASMIFFFKETRGSVLLSRKVKKLNKYYDELEVAGYYGAIMPNSSDNEKSSQSIQRIRWKCKADEERSSVLIMIRISLYRPFHMLFTEPVVFFFSLWISFSWAVLYMTLDAVPHIFQTTYGFNIQQSNAIFSAVCIASIIFLLLAVYQEKWGLKYLPEKQRRLLQTPEGRLYFACVESALLPIGILWLGVAGAYPQCPWIVPTIGVGCAAIGIGSVYLATFNYLADSYHRYASSALAAQSFCRNLLAGAFPLFTTQMFDNMTFQGAGGLLGGIGFLLTIVPGVLLLYGPMIRAKSKLAREIMIQD